MTYSLADSTYHEQRRRKLISVESSRPILFYVSFSPCAQKYLSVSRFAKRDRRPLDPPPVVRLRMYQVYNVDTDQATEQEISAEYVSFLNHLFRKPRLNTQL